MIQDLNHLDMVRLLRGCEPPLEHVNMLQELKLGEYVGGLNDRWEWTDEEDDSWRKLSERDLWQLYADITGDDRTATDCLTQVYVVADGGEDGYVDVKAVFTDEATAERYKDAKDFSCCVTEGQLNPRFEEPDQLWYVWFVPTTMEMETMKCWSKYENLCVGYVQQRGDNLCTWVIAHNRDEAKEKAELLLCHVIRGREQGSFPYLNQEIYIPDREFPDIRHCPFYDVASGKIVMGDFGAVLLPTSEALLPDGSPNPDLFILLDRHFVDNLDKKWGM